MLNGDAVPFRLDPFDRTHPTLLISSRIVTPHGILAGGISIRDGLIAEIIESMDANQVREFRGAIVDCGDYYILPGVIDAHVHVNQPGRTEWEGNETATKAAAAGGITAIVDMPLNSSPVTVSREALIEKRHSIAGTCWVDVGQYGGVIGQGSSFDERQLARDVESMIDEGVMGIKVFLCDSGLDEFPPVTRRELDIVMPILAKHGVPLLVHAELVPSDWCPPKVIEKYREWPTARARVFESKAIDQMIEMCARYDCPTHIVHLSNADSLPAIRRAKRESLPLTVETCPHYLFFNAESIPDRDPRYKCCPPIRELENRHRLWQSLELGEIDTVGSDHSPCPPAMKCLDTGDFARAWGGIASLQLLLPIMWHQAKLYEMPVTRLIECLSSAPSKLLGISAERGSIETGKFADLVIFDPDALWKVKGNELFHRHAVTPYDGVELCGRVVKTYLRGELVYDSGQVVIVPIGRSLAR